MPFTLQGVNAILDDGNEAVIWVAVGDGPAATDQTSNERIQMTMIAVDGRLRAVNVPMQFTGAALAGATHALFFSAESGGVFYGSHALSGDQAFGAAGQYNITQLVVG